MAKSKNNPNNLYQVAPQQQIKNPYVRLAVAKVAEVVFFVVDGGLNAYSKFSKGFGSFFASIAFFFGKGS